MSSKEAKDRLRKLTKVEGNTSCADCNAPRPTWTSLIVLPQTEQPVENDSIPKMLGTFICFRCSGAQRSIGSEFCVVKSMTLDSWTEEELRSIELGGNIIVNSAYEAKQVTGRPEQRAMLNPRKTFLKDKYVERKYLDTDRLEKVLRQILSSSQAGEGEAKASEKKEESSQTAGNIDRSLHLPSTHSESQSSHNNASNESSLNFDEDKLFPSPQLTNPKAASARSDDSEAADESQDDAFPEDFPSFPDFDNSRPDLVKDRSVSGGFADARQSFLATVPETNFKENIGTTQFDEFDDDEFGDDDGFSNKAKQSPASSKQQTPIAFEDLFNDGENEDDDNSEEDEFGDTLDTSFVVSPKPKPGEEPVQEPKIFDFGETSDSLSDTGVPNPPISDEFEAPTALQAEDDALSHSSQMSHSSHSSHSSEEGGSKVNDNPGDLFSQDPFGAEFAFKEEPLPPSEEILQSLDDPIKADASDTQEKTSADPFAVDRDEDSGSFESMDEPKPLDGAFKGDAFGALDTTNNDPVVVDSVEKDATFPSMDAFDTPDVSNKDPVASNHANEKPLDDAFNTDAFDTQDTVTKDPFAADSGENGEAFPSMDAFSESKDPFAAEEGEEKPLDDAFNTDAFGLKDTASRDPFAVEGNGSDAAFPSTESSAPFSFDGEDNVFSASSNKEEEFPSMPTASKSSKSDSDLPFSFDGADHAFSGSINEDEEFTPMPSTFNTSVSDSGLQLQTDTPKDPSQSIEADAFEEDAFAAFDKPTSSSLDDAFGDDPFGEQVETNADPFSATGDNDGFSESVNTGEDVFKVDNSSRADALPQSERSGNSPFHVTPSNRRRGKSVDDKSEIKKKKKKPPSLEAAFQRMSQRELSSRGTDEASTASSSSRPSVRSVRTAPSTRQRSGSLDRDEDVSDRSPTSVSSKGKRHTMQIGSKSFNSSQQKRSKPKPRSREGSLDRGASWGDALPEEDGFIDSVTPRAASMDERMLVGDDDDYGSGEPLERKEGGFAGSARQPGSGNKRAKKNTRSMSPFAQATRATKAKSPSRDDEDHSHTDLGNDDVGFKHSFRPPQRARSLNEKSVRSHGGIKPARTMPPRNELGSADVGSDDGFSNSKIQRVTMAGLSGGSDIDDESTGSGP